MYSLKTFEQKFWINGNKLILLKTTVTRNFEKRFHTEFAHLLKRKRIILDTENRPKTPENEKVLGKNESNDLQIHSPFSIYDDLIVLIPFGAMCPRSNPEKS